MKPAVGFERRRSRRIVMIIRARHREAADEKFAARGSVGGDVLSAFVDDPPLDDRRKEALLVALSALQLGLIFERVRVGVDRADRGHLGHPPRMQRRDAEFAQVVHQRLRHRRASDDDLAQQRQPFVLRPQEVAHAHPNGRNAGRVRHALILAEFDHAGRIEPFHRHDEVGADHQRDEGHPPRHDVEEWHDRQHPIALADAHCIGEADGEGVNVGRAVREQHALRIARRRRGVAQHRRGAFVDLGPVVRLRLRCQQFFVVATALQRFGTVAHDDERAPRVGLQRDRGLHRLHQRGVDEDGAIFGMVEHEGDLVGK